MATLIKPRLPSLAVQGLRKKCEEKGWLKDVDGLMGYFDKASTSGDPNKPPCFCMVGRDREPSEVGELKVDISSFVQIIKTTESQEGMPSRDVPRTTTVPRQRSSLRSSADDSKSSLPAFAARRKSQQRTEQRTWTTIGSNPFRDTTSNNENEGSLTKIGSISFDTIPTRTSSAKSFIRPKEDTSPETGERVTVTYSYIHLLETDTDPGCDEESENRLGSRFEF